MSNEDLTSEEAQALGIHLKEPKKKVRQTVVQNTGPLMILSLFLLLLAFFILLVSTAQIDTDKRAALFNSLAATFVANRRVQKDYDVRISEVGEYVDDDQIELHKRLWLALVPMLDVDTPSTGNVLELSMHSNTLFEPGSSALKASAKDLLRRIIGVLNNPREQYRVKILFQMGSIASVETSSALKQFFDGKDVLVEFRNDDKTKDIFDPQTYFGDIQIPSNKNFIVRTNRDTLQFTRSLSLAHELEKRGAKPQRIMVGIQENVPDTIRVSYERFAGATETTYLE